MEQLIEKLKVLHASNFAFYLKLHYFHWNVEGPFFAQFHELFGDLYGEVWEAVDNIAEHIRAVQGYAPGSMERFQELSRIKGQTDVPSAMEMINIALADNYEMITVITDAYRAAEEAGEVGLANFLQDRIDIHKKHGWMLRATSKV